MEKTARARGGPAGRERAGGAERQEKAAARRGQPLDGRWGDSSYGMNWGTAVLESCGAG